jgi:putative ABC transport system permease protein
MVNERLLALLAGCLGAVALVLSGGALYGLMSFTVGRQRREMAVRLALGAAPQSLLWSVVRDAIRLAASGAVIGLVGAALASSAAANLLYGITPLDAASFALAAGTLAVTTVVAAMLPAILAARLAPMIALKNE